ncbi:MAG: N-acetylmuramoyl-L-alanine amidase [Armatimonadota bacterium]
MLDKKPIICLDPGHPSEVGRGTKGRRITEIEAAWKVAIRAKKRLEDAGVEVVLTKSRPGELVRNRSRAEIANKSKADLMIRLHCDSQGGSGFAVYAPNKPGRNAGTRGPAPNVITASVSAAKIFHKRYAEGLVGLLADRGLKPDTETAVGAQQGALTGSIFSKVPVLLIEMGVLTNPKDDKILASDRGQAQVAEAVADAALAVINASKRPL